MKTLPDTETRAEIVRVLTALSDVVAEAGPDYVYPKKDRPVQMEGIGTDCYYLWEGKADCIVARTLVKLGISVSLLHEGQGIYSHTQIPLSPFSRELLSAAQDPQDRGAPWGDCLRLARNYADRQFGVTL